MHKLTKRADMWIGAAALGNAETIGYEVLGLPVGENAFIRLRPHGGWELFSHRGTDGSESAGVFQSEDDALSFLENRLKRAK